MNSSVNNMEVDEQGGSSCGFLLWKARNSGEGEFGIITIFTTTPSSRNPVILLML